MLRNMDDLPKNPMSMELVLILSLESPAGLYWTFVREPGETEKDPGPKFPEVEPGISRIVFS